MTILTDNIPENFPPCAVTIGCFDGVHRGHRYLIKQVKETAEKDNLKTVLITFPVHPRQVMQSEYRPQLLSCPQQKTELIESLDADYCVMLPFTLELSQLSAFEFMKFLRDRFNMRALVIGHDHRFGHNRCEGFDDYIRYGEKLGVNIVHAKAFIDQNTPISSSIIRNLLKKGDVEKANQYLGYAYFLNGTVVNGYKVGRKLGFPTANLLPSCPEKLIPHEGVYAVYVSVGTERFKGMLNIGHRPTVNNGNDLSIEVHILNFSGDIYQRQIRIKLIHFIREEKRFLNVDDLTSQLHKDRDLIEKLLPLPV